ncbi:hypothetical protein SKAU_G00412030 [Synaphobranchus kaupii]|uniref:Ubiquitin-like protease family profile domain-containing protein n=1 Tax=Synaphobranchus kaupii TaxID=118154 RepID=A0A9Q1IBT4_SYNKA|nr:hypothetical protein SKAU_G00412030 [Synaphobranchus kaupii]
MLKSTKGNRYCLTLTDYFTKWVEARTFAKKTAANVKEVICNVERAQEWQKLAYRRKTKRGIKRFIITPGMEVLKKDERKRTDLVVPWTQTGVKQPIGFGDEEYRGIFRNIAERIVPGSWSEMSGRDMQDIPRQTSGNDCGIFVLMYTLCICTDAPFHCTMGILQPVYWVGKQTTTQLPAHIQATNERTATKQALVDFIVKERRAEERVLAVITGKEPSKWLKGFQRKSPTKVPVYLDDDAQQDRLFNYLVTVLNSISPPFVIRDHILFVLEVLFPEAIIGALSALGKMTLQKAADKFSAGTHRQESEREEFNRKVDKDAKRSR